MIGPHTQDQTLEIRHLHADGTWRWHEVKLRNLLGDPAVAGIVANRRDVTAQRAHQDQLAHQASHDALTGLVNSAAFEDRLLQAVAAANRRSEPLAVVLVDLNRFKAVNDTLGHRVGDQLLVEVGRRLVAATRGGDIVARLGGDEFAVVLSTAADAHGAVAAAGRLVASLERPVAISGHSICVGASAGIARFPEDGDDPKGLLDRVLTWPCTRPSGPGSRWSTTAATWPGPPPTVTTPCCAWASSR